jgi:hypothetical protein
LEVAFRPKISEIAKSVDEQKQYFLIPMNKYKIKIRRFLGTIGDKNCVDGCGKLRFGAK